MNRKVKIENVSKIEGTGSKRNKMNHEENKINQKGNRIN